MDYPYYSKISGKIDKDNFNKLVAKYRSDNENCIDIKSDYKLLGGSSPTYYVQYIEYSTLNELIINRMFLKEEYSKYSGLMINSVQMIPGIVMVIMSSGTIEQKIYIVVERYQEKLALEKYIKYFIVDEKLFLVF